MLVDRKPVDDGYRSMYNTVYIRVYSMLQVNLISGQNDFNLG